MQKLYVVTRRDLSPGLQAAQSCHALRAFVAEHPATEGEWYETSNNLVVLAARGEPELLALLGRAQALGIEASAFREPDLEGALTAIALGPRARPLVSSLGLALAGPRAPMTSKVA